MILCGNIGLINDEGVEHTVIVDGTNLRFSPDSLTINEGDSVRFCGMENYYHIIL